MLRIHPLLLFVDGVGPFHLIYELLVKLFEILEVELLLGYLDHLLEFPFDLQGFF